MVRDYLKEVTDREEGRAKSRAVLEEAFNDPINRLDGITWKREDLYERNGGTTNQDEQGAKSMAILEQFFTERPLRLGKVTWTREDLYDRKG